MPRNGSGVFSNVPGTTVSANTTIQSAWANAFTADIQTTMNTAWPVSLGGTGGTSAITGSDAMNAQGANITAAATTDLSLATGTYVLVTGNTTITSFGTVAAGAFRRITFTGTPTLTHNATSLILPTGANIPIQAGDSIEAVSLGSGNWRVINYQSGNGIAPYSPGTLYGLTLSNNVTDATNDIDIAVGAARNSIDTANIDLLTALTKQLDVAWAVGTNAGMRATGVAIADATYHIFLIKRPDTGVVDIAADTNASGANIPTNTNAAYTLRRRIGSIIRSAGTILAFIQTGDNFALKTSVANRSSTAATAGAVVTLTVPLGIPVRPLLGIYQQQATVGNIQTGLADLSASSMPTIGIAVTTAAGEIQNSYLAGSFITNTLSQIFIIVAITSGTLTANILTTFGWIDDRGQS